MFYGEDFCNYSIFWQVPYAVGEMIVALLAYLLQHWQTFQIILSVLVLILAPLVVLILPESPRWLVATKETEKAMAIFSFGSKMNKSPFDSKKKILDENANHQRNHSEDKSKNESLLGVKSFFTEKVLMKNIIIICTNCLVATLCYYGITFNSVNFGGLDIYVSFALSGLTEIVGVVFIVFFLDHLGRRTILIGGQLLTGVMCIAANFLQEESENGALVCTLIGNYCE
jgi:Na+/melibiose symporter-like transporter